MNATIIVMLIWVGFAGQRGGPAQIEGFSSVDACRTAIPAVVSGYEEAIDAWGVKVRARCVEVGR